LDAANRGLRKSMAWVHGWLGLVAGWILFAMFVTGTASYFRPEITSWMQPELRPAQVPARQAALAAVAYLGATSPGDEQWFITLPDDRTPVTRVFTRPRPDAQPANKPPPRRTELKLDPASGTPLEARDTRGGEHFYRFHFQLQLPHPWGRWLAGLCAIFMLAAILSGVVTHKRIFVDLFTLRWGKGQRSWLDAHNASAVLALPFHAMITYTGLITLVAMYMPWPAVASYEKPAAFYSEAYGRDAEGEASGRAAPLAPLGPMIDAASRLWGDAPPRTVVIRHPGDAAATVTIHRNTDDRLNARGDTVTFAGVTGRIQSVSPAAGPAIATAGVMLGLHMGHFAPLVLRWSYFLLGLTGAAMVGTGLVLWTAKRRATGAGLFGFRLVERLNIGAIACLPAGMAAFLLANRLIPADLPDRAALEVSAMYYVWAGLFLASLLRPVRRAWIEALAISALAFAAVPLVNIATTDRGLLRSLQAGDLLFVGFDLTMIAVALALGFAARRAGRATAPRPARRGALSGRPRMLEPADAG
jgi:uncharacterized iron-regulated membrane protein